MDHDGCDSREAVASFSAGAAMGGFEGEELDRLAAAFAAGVDIGWNWRATEEASYIPADKPSGGDGPQGGKHSEATEEPRRSGTQPGLFFVRKPAPKERVIQDRRPLNRAPSPVVTKGAESSGSSSSWESETRLYVCWRGPRYIAGTELSGGEREKYEGIYYRSWEALKRTIGGDPVASGSGLGFERIEPQLGSSSSDWVALAETFFHNKRPGRPIRWFDHPPQ